jgi:hypothetical protein
VSTNEDLGKVEAPLIIRQILEKSHEYNITLHQLYIDFKQALDSIDRSQIIKAMMEYGIPAKLITLTKMTLSRTHNKVKIQNKLSGSFRTECGIRQGDSLSTLLFNIGLEKVMRNVEINPGGTIFNRTRQFMAYADDVAVIGRSVGVLNEVLMQLQTAAASTGLVINTTKTKYMRSKEIIGAANVGIKLYGQIYEKVDNFKYLGALVTSHNETETDIKDKIAVGNHCF